VVTAVEESAKVKESLRELQHLCACSPSELVMGASSAWNKGAFVEASRGMCVIDVTDSFIVYLLKRMQA